MTKILAIISTHGNELLGPNILSYMLNKRSELLEYVDLWWLIPELIRRMFDTLSLI